MAMWRCYTSCAKLGDFLHCPFVVPFMRRSSFFHFNTWTIVDAISKSSWMTNPKNHFPPPCHLFLYSTTISHNEISTWNFLAINILHSWILLPCYSAVTLGKCSCNFFPQWYLTLYYFNKISPSQTSVSQFISSLTSLQMKRFTHHCQYPCSSTKMTSS